jgi:hypothetical protein
MATYAERAALVTDTGFQARIQMALWIAATDVMNEDASTEKHARRMDWAKNALKSSVADNLREVAVRVLANPTVGAAGAAAADADIQFVVSGLVNTFIERGQSA